MFTKHCLWKTGPYRFNSFRSIFWARNFTYASERARKKRAHKTKKPLETLLFVLYFLSRTCDFHFQCIFIESFCNNAFLAWRTCLNTVRMSKTRSLPFSNVAGCRLRYKCFYVNFAIFLKTVFYNISVSDCF